MTIPSLLAAGLCMAAGAPAPDLSQVPGVVVDYTPASSQVYIGCPSIAILPNGEYLASHSFFGPGSTMDTTCVHRSRDRGRTWEPVTRIKGQWWSTLFLHRDALYIMGVSKRYGDVVIRRSTDNGATWTEPRDGESGLLGAGGQYHCAPVPVIVHRGRVWRAMEDALGGGGWAKHFRSFMISAPEDADLLRAESWSRSNVVASDRAWLDGKCGGWLEGNAVAAPDGGVVNILRVDCPQGETAAMIRVSPDGKRAEFDPAHDFLSFPGGATKFTIRWDPTSRLYWALSNPVRGVERGTRQAGAIRNTLALVSAPDLRQWSVRSILQRHPDVLKHGFQYVDWQFDGEDLVVVSRTAYDDGLGGAHNYHDANCFTFHRVPGFRRRTMDDTPLQ